MKRDDQHVCGSKLAVRTSTNKVMRMNVSCASVIYSSSDGKKHRLRPHRLLLCNIQILETAVVCRSAGLKSECFQCVHIYRDIF